MFSRDDSDPDPITAAIAPPHDESPHERQIRLLNEQTAKEVSDGIDEQISRERQQAKREPKPVKILLLGQSESGKSTTLKNFQLMVAPQAFRAERASWRAIIHLNVIRSVRIILDALARASNPGELPPSPRSSYSSRDSIRPDTDLMTLRTRLLPLLQIEDVLVQRLANHGTQSVPDGPSPSDTSHIPMTARRRHGKEVAVNSTVAWKSAFMRKPTGRESFDSQDVVDWDDPNDPGAVLHARREEMQRLWGHPMVRTILASQGIRLHESAGFFLDDLDTICAPRYVPTDDHVLRARLKTLGVSEHRMRLTDPQGGITRQFHIFDVGGQRSMRPKWVPYFDDVDAIIFLAPISAFDQALAEDPRINRLADSVELWTAVISNKLLQNTNVILFLNKVDIMQAKLTSGIKLVEYCPTYGRRPNDFDSASRFLKKQFSTILKQSSPSPRIFYCHLTNVIDVKSTTYVLAGIKDQMMRFNLKESNLIL
ncbi:guanine nucleotide binding protein, alpha subunit [Mycena maculata]|uniref:Guanine nucleotide binding protein, alpha subunit n=1 Tax=Mycena maculata TaxID=230809 RepID=A0AAD7MW21_9AGAR|nr:guanine nucleotide binding protein, alpha subunit [Mycena maculata]